MEAGGEEARRVGRGRQIIRSVEKNIYIKSVCVELERILTNTVVLLILTFA